MFYNNVISGINLHWKYDYFTWEKFLSQSLKLLANNLCNVCS